MYIFQTERPKAKTNAPESHTTTIPHTSPIANITALQHTATQPPSNTKQNKAPTSAPRRPSPMPSPDPPTPGLQRMSHRQPWPARRHLCRAQRAQRILRATPPTAGAASRSRPTAARRRRGFSRSIQRGVRRRRSVRFLVHRQGRRSATTPGTANASGDPAAATAPTSTSTSTASTGAGTTPGQAPIVSASCPACPASATISAAAAAATTALPVGRAHGGNAYAQPAPLAHVGRGFHHAQKFLLLAGEENVVLIRANRDRSEGGHDVINVIVLRAATSGAAKPRGKVRRRVGWGGGGVTRPPEGSNSRNRRHSAVGEPRPIQVEFSPGINR